ncbi:MAG: tetratricopeptide repeat protein [Chloroflexales bacterium]|nr:tetratricopeptide repeat protein [Chloroflexales bacterium]
MLSLSFFGAPRIEHAGQLVPFGRTKALALLAYLALVRHPQERDILAALLWPEFDGPSARNNLRRELSLLKTTLGIDLLVAEGSQVRWNPQVASQVDVALFQTQLAAVAAHGHPSGALCPSCAQALAVAAELYHDDLLSGFSVPDCPAFEEWQFFEAEGLRQQLAQALQALLMWHQGQVEYARAIPYARRWLALDPLHEPAHRALMALYGGLGQWSAAARQYEECVRRLADELGAAPEDETVALHARIRERRLPPPPGEQTPATPPAPAGLPLVRHLPASATTCIGREHEIRAIGGYLGDPTCRIVTLTGPGGVGKTRLAQAATAASTAGFRDGAAFVSLAAVADPHHLAPAILAALEVHLIGSTDPLGQLLAYLHDRQLLLLLDNVEQMLAGGGATVLAQLVAAAPQVSLLVTSRERLQLAEEWVYPVAGLGYPDAATLLPEVGEASAAYGAIHLFFSYARRAQASFAPAAADLAEIAQICRLLDGLPLGLELAAPWIQSMTCREIADEIARDLNFLQASLPHLPERHRSLRAVFAHTWQGLAPDEREVLRCMSVFQGGCLREAAEQVAGASLASLQALASKALLRREGSGRYTLHELVRQFAHEQLQRTPGTAAQLRDRHCAYYTQLLERLAPLVRGGRQTAALTQIEADITNIRAAWQWASDRRDMASIARALECLWDFYEQRCAFREGASLFEAAGRALGRPDAPPQPDDAGERESVRALRLAGQGDLCARAGAMTPGVDLMLRGVATLRSAARRESRKEALASAFLSYAYLLQGGYQGARARAQEALPIYAAHGDPWGLATCFLVLGGSAAGEGRLTEAEYFLTEAVRTCRRDGVRNERHIATTYLAEIALARGDYAQAMRLLAENRALHQEQAITCPHMTAAMLLQEGQLARAHGRLDEALGYIQRGVAIYRDHGVQPGGFLPALGGIYRLKGDHEQAQAVLQDSLSVAQAGEQPLDAAASLVELARLAVEQRDFVHAEQLQREALSVYQQLGSDLNVAAVRCDLGVTLVAMGLHTNDEVRSCFAQALEVAVLHHLVPLALAVFVGCAAWQFQLGRAARAAELLSYPLHHPASTHEIRVQAHRRAALMASSSPSDGVPATGAAARDWQAAAEQLAAELSSAARP